MELFRRLIEKWQNRASLGDNQLARQELAFLPAAMEIREKPPHPASRVTGWVLLTLFTIGLVWACVGEVDIVATAEGKIIPSGQVKLIQPLGRSVVAAILVKEGQRVEAGQPLVELDQGQTGADLERLEQENRQNRLNYQRLSYFKTYLELAGKSTAELSTPETTGNGQVNTTHASQWQWPDADLYQQRQQTLLLLQQQKNIDSGVLRLKKQLANKQAEQQVNRALINKLKGTLPLITQRVDALKQLMHKQMAARAQYLELEQLRIEQEQDLIGAQARNNQLKAQIDEIRLQQQSFITEARSENLQQLLQTDREYQSLRQELIKARDMNKKQQLIAPVSGIVQELAIHTIGGVVTEAQPLMKIVPEHQQLEVEAWLENKDIGFVYPEQPAEIKVHTFPFTKYGIINGTVDTVSADATADEQRGLIYKAKVMMDKTSLVIDGRSVQLVPGMGVSAEIKIGKRLLIEYILTPLLRYKDESVGER